MTKTITRGALLRVLAEASWPSGIQTIAEPSRRHLTKTQRKRRAKAKAAKKARQARR